MKKSILILLVCVFALSNVFAQDKKVSKDNNSKVAEVILSTEMHCANCADKVKKQLAYTKGVIDVQADHEKDAVYIKYRSDKTDSQKLIASLKEIGYDAKVFAQQHQCQHAKQGGCSGDHSKCQQAKATAQPAHGEHKCNGNHSNCQQHKSAEAVKATASPNKAEHKCNGDHSNCQHGKAKVEPVKTTKMVTPATLNTQKAQPKAPKQDKK